MAAGIESGKTGKPTQKERLVQMSFELDPELKKNFEHVIIDQGKTRCSVLREFIKKYVADHNKPVVY